jgi:hypothetical protein
LALAIEFLESLMIWPHATLKGQSSIGFMGGKWVANKLLHKLKSSDSITVLLPTHFLKKIVVYAYILSSNIIEDI